MNMKASAFDDELNFNIYEEVTRHKICYKATDT